ncbi:8916_t:CDS:1, partial [Dentiscutata erythropus]
ISLQESIDVVIEKSHELQGSLLAIQKEITEFQPKCELCDNLKAQFEKIKSAVKIKKNQNLYNAVMSMKKDSEEFKDKYYKLNTKYNKMVELYEEITD